MIKSPWKPAQNINVLFKVTPVHSFKEKTQWLFIDTISKIRFSILKPEASILSLTIFKMLIVPIDIFIFIVRKAQTLIITKIGGYL